MATTTTQIPTTNEQASTAQRIARVIERNGWLREDATPAELTPTHPLPILHAFDSDKDRHECWALESLYVALTHHDPIVAFRAFGQAREYGARVKRSCLLTDAQIDAQNRLEAFISRACDAVYGKSEAA